jgi:hypothetical protein
MLTKLYDNSCFFTLHIKNFLTYLLLAKNQNYFNFHSSDFLFNNLMGLIEL